METQTKTQALGSRYLGHTEKRNLQHKNVSEGKVYHSRASFNSCGKRGTEMEIIVDLKTFYSVLCFFH
jgi:hypothetical protein